MNRLPLRLLLSIAVVPTPVLAQAPAPVAESASFPISRGTLDRYAGSYRLDSGIALLVWREGDGLVVEASGQAPWALLPVSETGFRVKGMDARIEFVFGANDEVSHLVLTQDGRDMRALRQ